MGINSHGRDWERDLSPLFLRFEGLRMGINSYQGTGNGN